MEFHRYSRSLTRKRHYSLLHPSTSPPPRLHTVRPDHREELHQEISLLHLKPFLPPGSTRQKRSYQKLQPVVQAGDARVPRPQRRIAIVAEAGCGHGGLHLLFETGLGRFHAHFIRCEDGGDDEEDAQEGVGERAGRERGERGSWLRHGWEDDSDGC